MRLNDYLQQKGLTQEQFALLVGVKQNAVSQWISGERYPRPLHLKKIKKVTKGVVSGDDMLTVTPC